MNIKETQNMVECVGEYNQQKKTVFDIDAYDAWPEIHNIIDDINKIFPDKPVKHLKANRKNLKETLKCSHR